VGANTVTDAYYEVTDFYEKKVQICVAFDPSGSTIIPPSRCEYAWIDESEDGARFVIHISHVYKGFSRTLDSAIKKAKVLLAESRNFRYQEE
jgi:hypothetical protein